MFCFFLIEIESDTLAEQIKEHFKHDSSEAPARPLKQPFVIGKYCFHLQRMTRRIQCDLYVFLQIPN